MNNTMQGVIFHCPVCGAELTMLARYTGGSYHLRCCNVEMERLPYKVVFYICPVCGAEIGVLNQSHGKFIPRCCGTEMLLKKMKAS